MNVLGSRGDYTGTLLLAVLSLLVGGFVLYEGRFRALILSGEQKVVVGGALVVFGVYLLIVYVRALAKSSAGSPGDQI